MSKYLAAAIPPLGCTAHPISACRAGAISSALLCGTRGPQPGWAPSSVQQPTNKPCQEMQHSGKLPTAGKRRRTHNAVLTEVTALSHINQRYLKEEKWEGHCNKDTWPTQRATCERLHEE